MQIDTATAGRSIAKDAMAETDTDPRDVLSEFDRSILGRAGSASGAAVGGFLIGLIGGIAFGWAPFL